MDAGCAFAADIRWSRTWMLGSFESVRWNASVPVLDLGFYPYWKEFWGNAVRTHVNSKGRIPSTGKILLRRRSNPWLYIKEDQHTTNWDIPAPAWVFEKIYILTICLICYALPHKIVIEVPVLHLCKCLSHVLFCFRLNCSRRLRVPKQPCTLCLIWSPETLLQQKMNMIIYR